MSLCHDSTQYILELRNDQPKIEKKIYLLPNLIPNHLYISFNTNVILKYLLTDEDGMTISVEALNVILEEAMVLSRHNCLSIG